jgi:hypothetical protein
LPSISPADFGVASRIGGEDELGSVGTDRELRSIAVTEPLQWMAAQPSVSAFFDGDGVSKNDGFRFPFFHAVGALGAARLGVRHESLRITASCSRGAVLADLGGAIARDVPAGHEVSRGELGGRMAWKSIAASPLPAVPTRSRWCARSSQSTIPDQQPDRGGVGGLRSGGRRASSATPGSGLVRRFAIRSTITNQRECLQIHERVELADQLGWG